MEGELTKMLLQDNTSGSMNVLILIYSLFFWIGLIVVYIVIIYAMDHPKKKKIMVTYSTNLKRYTQDNLTKYDLENENRILLVKTQNNKN